MNYLKYFFVILVITTSCKRKKLTEYTVEVPLPSNLEKLEIGKPEDVVVEKGNFILDKFPFNYNDLEPTISKFTMENHYSKHYVSYINNVNKSIVGTIFEGLTVEEILPQIDINNLPLKNNIGGYYNHKIFWESLSEKTQDLPIDTLAGTIKRDFGNNENFIASLKNNCNAQIGSGWTWLIVDHFGKLQIVNTANNDNPLMPKAIIKGTPLLALDMWEHAYYIDYQYKRKDYINALINKINWKNVSVRYEKTLN